MLAGKSTRTRRHLYQAVDLLRWPYFSMSGAIAIECVTSSVRISFLSFLLMMAFGHACLAQPGVAESVRGADTSRISAARLTAICAVTEAGLVGGYALQNNLWWKG